MSIADRALRAFETELVKLLSFTFTAMRCVDPSGAPRTRLRVWMRNNSNITLTNVRGSIGPGEAAAFRYTTFHLETLPPQREVEVARIDAKVTVPAEQRFALDGIATVNVSGAVDLGSFRFKDTARNLTYVAARITVDGTADEPLVIEPASPRASDDVPILKPDWSKVSDKKRSA